MGPVFVVLAIAAASVMSPGAEGSDVSQSQALAACVTSSVETAEQADVRDSMVPGVPADAIGQQAVAAAADDYVLCAARAGLVDTATVLSSNTGVASIADGSEIEFTLPAATAAWFVAQLVEAGVVVSAADRLELGDSETTGSATTPTNRLVVGLGLTAVAAFATWFIWAYLRRRR